MSASSPYRLTLVVVLAGAFGMIGGDFSSVGGETQNVKGLAASRTGRSSGEAVPQAAVRSEESATVSRKDVEFERVRALARASGSVRVIVQLEVPNMNALTAASRAAKGPGPIAAADGQLSAGIAGVRQAELGKLVGTPHTINRTYASVPFIALTVSEQALNVLQASPVILGINEDRLAAPILDNTVNITGASAAWTQGLDGTGWHVAILDTGIRASHNFFAGKTIVQACFASGEDGAPGAGDCPNGLSSDTTSPNAARHFPTSPTSDHGTHVSGIATGNDPGRVPPLYGIARGADIIAIQVFSQFFASPYCGGGDCVLSYSSDQMAGLDHVYSLRSTYDIPSANMSIGGGFYDNQATCDANNAGVKAAVDNLRGAGIATVIASGNDGYCDGISGPGCISTAVAVGATDDSDFEAGFSNFHSTLLDIYAPGVNILSSVGSSDSSYNGTWSGTSMATPHVAGAWAILKQADPGADVATILSALQTTGVSVVGRCVGAPTQRRIQIDQALGTGRIKFSQPPDDTGEDAESDIDWTDMIPNVVVADDFVSDGRPITAVRWWGSNIPPPPQGSGLMDNGGTMERTTKSSPRAMARGQYPPNSKSPSWGRTVESTNKRVSPTVLTRTDPSNVAVVGGDTCATAGAIAGLPFSDTGNTCTFADNYDEICPYAVPGAADVVYSFTPLANVSVDISLCANSAYDTKLYVYENACGAYQSGSFLACNDDTCTTPSYPAAPFVSTLVGVNLTAGNTYYIVVDGYDPSSCGNYTLDIVENVPYVCPTVGPCTLSNGNFETGTLTGWTATDTGTGTWVVNNGLFDPDSPDGPIPPCCGAFGAMTDPLGTGVRTLYQDVAVPAAGSVSLHWVDMLRNHAGDYVDPGQEFRVEIRNPVDNSVLEQVFSTNPGDPALTTCNTRCVDISAYAGQTIRLAFVEEDSLFYFNVHIDDVCIVADGTCPTGACCEAGTAACLLNQTQTACTGNGGIYQGDDSTTCTVCPPVICGDGIVGTGEQCDPPDGVFCDSNCRTIFNPPIDGWLVSFHEPLAEGGSPSPPLALYFCDATIVTVAATSLGACDGHAVRQYDVDLADCCLVHSYPDSRPGADPVTPGEKNAFLETACFAYDIDIQAVIGHKYVPKPGPIATGGNCVEVVTGNTATAPFWGWHTTSVEHGLRSALQSVVSMSGPDWLYGPWSPLAPDCSAPNMAFQLITDVSGGGDCNNNGVPDVCDTGPDCQPNGILDECEIAAGAADCNGNSVPDECDILTDGDCNGNGVLDECEAESVGSLTSYLSAVMGFVDISGTGTPLNLGDDESANVTMPFTPAAFGGPTVSVANNGGVGLVPDTGLGPVDNWPLPHVNAFGGNPGLLAYWDDLDSTTGNIYYQTVGITPNQTFIVQWHNRPHYPGDAFLDGDEVTFEVQIFESPVGNAVAQYLYADTNFLNAAFNNGASATVGYQRSATSANQWSYNTAGAVTPSLVLSLLKGDLNGNGIPDACDAPGDIVWDSAPLSPDRTTRSLRLKVTSAGPGTPPYDAIKVTMIDLQHPVPANLPASPPPEFDCWEAGATCGTVIPAVIGPPPVAACTGTGEANSCARWVGKLGTFLESQDLGPVAGTYRAARLQCTPFYTDWVTETASALIAVYGAEIVPSSEYSVQTYGASCLGAEEGCTNKSTAVTMYTRRSGDVGLEFNPPSTTTTQPNVFDIEKVVSKLKGVPTALVKAITQLQPNLPDPNADINALDIVAVVDGVKEKAYAFSGPCACPSTVPCNTTACSSGGQCTGLYGSGAICVKTCNSGDNIGEPCINNTHCGKCLGGVNSGNPCDANGDCPLSTCSMDVCGNAGANPGYCRDACGRCTP